jgi:hypothetical protein
MRHPNRRGACTENNPNEVEGDREITYAGGIQSIACGGRGPASTSRKGSDVHWLNSLLQVWVEGFRKTGADGGTAELKVFLPDFRLALSKDVQQNVQIKH